MKSRKIVILVLLFAILIINCERDKNTTTATIIHWNDFHAANLPYKPTYKNPQGFKVGGYANVAGYIDSLREVYPHAVTMNAGDDFQGSPVSSITKGKSQILILNALGLDVFTLGNHEFDYGFKKLRKNIKLAEFPIVASNIFVKESGKLMVPPYKILQSGATKIGVIGVMLETLKSSSLPKNVKEIEVVEARDQVQKYADSLESKVDLTVVLSHQGFYPDSILATQLDKVDAIIGGHSHTWLTKPVEVNDILICQVGSRGERLGVINARVDTINNRVINYDYEYIRTILGRVKPDQKVNKVVDSLDALIAARMDRQISYLQTDWTRSSRGESNIGNWFTDAIRERFNTDIAFQNSGGIRKGLSAGPITERDIWEICPFDNTVEIISVKGDTLTQMIRWRIEHPRDLLQTSGMKRIYNGQTDSLLKVIINGQPIDPDQTYTIATNNYITGHSQRFFGFSAAELQIEHTGIVGRDVLIEAAEKADTINSQIEGRIMDVATK
ncbi:MAG: bifunctional metallophosphatase/5'-nucleotidase [Candidatus Marinimicrobia bacterium]|nr:bifunctional metallophosphatase/5'-nucleotidase [Candidatus Neomarinimicrobiota bacterium]